MKKYRVTFETLRAAFVGFCDEMRACDDCPFTDRKIGNQSCDDYCNAHPEETAAIIGAEVVEVEDKPRLTEQELAICKALGARWVSRNECNYDNVNLWEIEPTKSVNTSPRQYIARNGSLLAAVNVCLFPSLNPGDCVNVEELLK